MVLVPRPEFLADVPTISIRTLTLGFISGWLTVVPGFGIAELDLKKSVQDSGKEGGGMKEVSVQWAFKLY